MATILLPALCALARDALVAEGNRPKLGQAYIVIDPNALAGNDAYYERVETLLAAMLTDDGVRIPGYRRNALADKAGADGVTIPDALLKQLQDLAAGS